MFNKLPLIAKMILGYFLIVAVYLTVALLCLRQWDSPTPWLRVDFFSGGAIVMSIVLAIEQLSFGKRLPQSKEVLNEAFGISYDPGMGKLVGLIALLELTVFLDYGHWRLVPGLEHPVLQGAGLATYALVTFWLLWVDKHLSGHFADEQTAQTIITDGPFRFLRHPRYAGLIASRIAFALALASLLGWILVIGWVLVVRRRINLEEPHLRELFGTRYEAYAKNTARLLPRIY